jgi:hypothetical protein
MSQQQRSTSSFIGNFAFAGKKMATFLQPKAHLASVRRQVCRYQENQKNKSNRRCAFQVKDRRDTKIFPRFFDFSIGYVPLTAMNTIDLTQRPPRSPRVTLGGYVILPRMLDKGRAQLAGKAGDYHFNCSLDQRFASFAGVNSEDILQLLKEGKSDSDILAWIREHGKRSDFEIVPWSQFQLQRSLG